MPLLYRDAPLSSIWEGSGNVNALDVLRALRRFPEALDALLAEARGVDARVDATLRELTAELSSDDLERRARRIVELLALALQASLLVRHAPAYVADAFCASRLGREGGHEYGTLPPAVDAAAIVARHMPRLD